MTNLTASTSGVKVCQTAPKFAVAADSPNTFPAEPAPYQITWDVDDCFGESKYVPAAEIAVVSDLVDDDFRLFFWSLPQFAPWIGRLLSKNRKDPLVQGALSFLLEHMQGGNRCRVWGGHWAHAEHVARLAGTTTGLDGFEVLKNLFAEVGIEFTYHKHLYRRRCRTYHFDGIPDELTEHLKKYGCRPRERAARLDNVSPEPSGRPAHRFHQLTAKQRRLAVAKNIAEVAVKMPEKAERLRLYEDATGAHQEEIASNLVQLIEKAREMDVDESVYAGIHEAAAYGLPGPCANPDSTSARIGGTLGKFPSKLQPLFVSGYVAADLRASTPMVAAFLAGSDASRAFMTECADLDISPTTRIASELLAQLGVPLDAQLGPERFVLDAAAKQVKQCWIVGLNGGTAFVMPQGDLVAQDKAGGQPRRVPGFFEALLRHSVVADTIEGTWGSGGLASQLVARGWAICKNGYRVDLRERGAESWADLRKRAARAISDTYNDFEWVGIKAAQLEIGRSSNFSRLGDSHDGFSLKRLNLQQLDLEAIGKACAAARRALLEVGVDGCLRVKYDAQRGGELEDESTMVWLLRKAGV